MKIVIGIDGSSAAQSALDLIGAAEWPAGTQLRIIDVVELDPEMYGLAGIAYAPTESLAAQLVHAAEVSLAAAARRFEGGPLHAETALLRGRPADVLLEEARRGGADLIIVGSRGHGTLDAMLLGSVSAEIVSRAHVPVLVVRSTAVGRALLAWDGSPAAEAAIELLASWPALRRAEVRVASVVDHGPWWATVPPVVPAEAVTLFEDAWQAGREKAMTGVRRVAGQLREAGVVADEIVLDGDPGAALIQAARDWHADLVVMGTHGRHGIARVVLGSVARTLVLHAPASVLVVPTPAASRPQPAEHQTAGAVR